MRRMWSIYHDEVPEFLKEFMQLDIMKRIEKVGMNCGCEYTQFELFQNLRPYTRFDHSVGCALIVWHFTHDMKQCLAALFHDVATPAFSHVIDFLHHDHLNQESTEEKTVELLKGSDELMYLLDKYDIRIDEISDYHMYPIADNDTPLLSSDRLEYTLSNLYNYDFCTLDEVRSFYDDLCVGINEIGEPELCFRTEKTAEAFALCALKTAKIYVADADRLIMQVLSDVIEWAIDKNMLSENDLYMDEEWVIHKMMNHEETSMMWKSFCQLKSVRRSSHKENTGLVRVVNAKKRWINPMVKNGGRISDVSKKFCLLKDEFLMQKFDEFLVSDDEIPYLS